MQLAAQQKFALAHRSLGELYGKMAQVSPLDMTLAGHWYRLSCSRSRAIQSLKKHLQRLPAKIT